MNNQEEVIGQIVAIALDDSSYEEMLEMNASALHESLYDAAVELFGSWDAALLEAIRHVAATSQAGASSRERTSSRSYVEGPVERKVTDAFEEPIYVSTKEGRFFSMHGPTLAVTEELQRLEGPEGAGGVTSLRHIGEPDAVFLFSTHGRYFGIDTRMIPNWAGGDQRRTIRDILFLETGERVEFVMPRQNLGSGRLIHVTAQGKGKATAASDLSRGIDRTGREAFLLNEGDVPVAVLAGSADNTVFCASAMGQGIHFEASELRSMGCKAVGVNMMKLDGPEDAIVAGLLGKNVRQLAVLTQQGYAKRVDFTEFRTQGRAGAGMQLIRLQPGDRVVGVVACNLAEDLAIITASGLVRRLPTTEFPFMGRAARGNRLLEIDEPITGLAALPCGSNS